MGAFIAWDAATGHRVWEMQEKFPVWSGALATAGDVVFYGTLDGWFKAVDARTGTPLWKFKVGSGVVGAPISYRGPDGKQYVAVYAGIGGDWSLIAGDVRGGPGRRAPDDRFRTRPSALHKPGRNGVGIRVMRHYKGLLIAALLLPAGLVHGDADAPPGAVSDSQHVPAGKATPPAATLSNPFSDDANAALQGEKLFAAMNCDGCHGGGALGFAAPSLADGRWRFGGEDGAVFHSIFYGRPHGMPAYGDILPQSVVWLLVTYVKTRPVPREVPTAAWRVTP